MNDDRIDWFGRAETDWVRTACAIAVLCVHFVENESNLKVGILSVFSRTGFLWVGIFFSLSGYGLSRHFFNRGVYSNDFLPRHLIKLLSPVFVSELVYIIINIIFLNRNIYWTDILLFTKLVSFSWYVVSISIVYIVFFICMRITSTWLPELFCGLILFN